MTPGFYITGMAPTMNRGARSAARRRPPLSREVECICPTIMPFLGNGTLQSVCVFCGSNAGAGEAYAEAARRLARAITARGLKLIYGGGSIGLMGVLGEAALVAGGHVIGITPRRLLEGE